MEEKKRSNSYSVFFVILLVACLLILQFGHIEFQSEDTKDKIVLIYDTLQSAKPKVPEVDSVVLASDSLAIDVDSLVVAQDTTTSELLAAQPADTISDLSYFSSLEAIAVETKKSRKNKPVIRYYTKPDDGEKVYALRQFGYYIHERESPIVNDHISNSIFYGDSVQTDDLLLISYTLISKGMKIRQIVPSKYHDGWKYSAVEIGTDTTIANLPLIQISDLKKELGVD